MAKLKQIATDKEMLLSAALKTLTSKKFLGEQGAQALATAIASKLDIADVSYDEETGVLKIGDVEISPMTAPNDGEDGQVLIYKTGDDGQPSTEWGDINYDKETGKLTVLDEVITPIQVPTTATAGQVLTFTGDSSNPEVTWADLNLGDITVALTKFVTKAVYVESYTSQAGDGTTGLTDAPAIVFYHDDTVLCAISAQPFIKDGMVTGGVVTDGTGDNVGKKVLKLTLNTDAGIAPIEIPLDVLFSADNYYSKDELANLLYGSTTGNVDSATADSVVGKIKKYVQDYLAEQVKFGEETSGVLPISIGSTTKNVLTQHQSLADYVQKSELYGEGGTAASPADGSIAKKVKDLDNVTSDITNITDKIYGTGKTSENDATAESIIGRLKALEDIDFTEITGAEVEAMIAKAKEDAAAED